MMHLDDDIKKAIDVINYKDELMFKTAAYYNTSAIHMFANENIKSYQKYLENREKILSVTASGDQILTSILLALKR